MSTTFAGFPASAPVNSQVTGTANFVNTSAVGTATTASFTLQLPPNLTGVVVNSAILGAGTYIPASGLVTFAPAGVVNVTPSATVSASISFNQTTTGVSGTGTTGALNDTNPANNTNTFSVGLTALADMSVSFAGFPPSAPVNAVVNGIVNFTNVSGNPVITATFALQLPVGLGLANVTVTSVVLGVGIYNPATGIVVFGTPTLAVVGANAVISAVISFLQTPTGVSGSASIGALNDSNPVNNTSQFSVTVFVPTSDMSVSFAGFPSSAPVNTLVSGIATFSNVSGNAATSAIFNLQLPAGLNPATVTINSAVLGVGTYNPTTGAVTFAIPPVVSVAPGAIITASISFLQTSIGVTGVATTGAQNDTNATNNVATFIVAPLLADMSVTFVGFPSVAPVNAPVTGTAIFANIHPNNPAVTAVFTLQLQPGLSPATVFVTSSILGVGSYNTPTGVVTFPVQTLANVAPGSTITASISFTQTVTGVQGIGTTGALNDINFTNNTATFSVAASIADMSASFVGLPSIAPVNTVVTGSVNFVNVSVVPTGTATSAVFSIQLPPGLNPANVTVTSVLLGLGTYNTTTGVVTFAAPVLGSVAPGATITASISFLQSLTGLIGTATTGALNDLRASNNIATFEVAPSVADMSATFAGFPDVAPPNSAVTGTVTFVNVNLSSSSTATSAAFTLQLPPRLLAANVTVTSAILGIGVYNSATGVVTFPSAPAAINVAPGATVSASISFLQTTTGVQGTGTTGAINDINPGNNTANFFVSPGNNAVLSGRVFLEVNRNKVFDPGVDLPLANFRAEVIRVTGTTTVVIGSAFTDITGRYRIENLPLGPGYSVRFFDGLGNVIFGTPFNQAAFTESGFNRSVGTNSLTSAIDPQLAPFASQISNVTLYPGDNVWEQNLPLDPSGIVYNSVTRKPVEGATVRLIGPPGFTAVNIVGGADVRVTGPSGVYQFFFETVGPNAVTPALGGQFRIEVTQPADYLPVQAVQGGVGPDQGVFTAVTGSTKIQPNANPPAVGVNGVAPVVGLVGGPGTQYFLRLNFSFNGFQEIIHNHIPLDPVLVPGAILVTKTGDKTVAEVGDSVQYKIGIRNTTVGPITNIKLNDLLPAGFRFIPGTARLGSLTVANPAGGIGRDLLFDIGTIAGQASVELTYYVRLGVGSQQGDGINQATVVAPVRSNTARFKVTVQGGVFSNEGCITGKVYVDCDGNSVQNNTGGSRELGIPGVRLVMLDGTFILTDSEGKYSICGVKPQTHVIKVDRTTLPKGSRMVPSSNRNAGVGDSLFVDLKGGELARADFIEGSCSPEVLDQVKARRAQGGVAGPEVEIKLPLKIENRPLDALQQMLPETRQKNAAPAKSGDPQ